MGVRMTGAADAMAAIEIKIIATRVIEDAIALSPYKREWKRDVSLEQRLSHGRGGKVEREAQALAKYLPDFSCCNPLQIRLYQCNKNCVVASNRTGDFRNSSAINFHRDGGGEPRFTPRDQHAIACCHETQETGRRGTVWSLWQPIKTAVLYDPQVL
jgi:hypothetical protein